MLINTVTVLSALIALAICYFTGGYHSLAWLWQVPVGFIGSFVVLGLIAFVIFWISCSLVDQSKPQEQDSPYYRLLTKLYCPSIFPLLLTKIHTTGVEKLPKDGRFLLVSNHLNILDPVLLLAKLPQAQLAFISKQENADMFLIGNLMHKIQCQMINRDNDREALKTIIKCISIVKEDKASICVFPEGYTSKDGLLHHFRNGVFKIAQKAHVPIVVCTIQGTNQVFHNAKRFKRTNVELHVVDVIPAEDLVGVHTTDIGERVFNLMADDLGHDQVAAE